MLLRGSRRAIAQAGKIRLSGERAQRMLTREDPHSMTCFAPLSFGHAVSS
jgi:hypothetical protein